MLKVVELCRLYVGIFGMRYGTIPDGHDRSMTHIEYDEAKRLTLPSLIYILNEDHPIPAKDVETRPRRNASGVEDLSRKGIRDGGLFTMLSPEPGSCTRSQLSFLRWA